MERSDQLKMIQGLSLVSGFLGLSLIFLASTTPRIPSWIRWTLWVSGFSSGLVSAQKSRLLQKENPFQKMEEAGVEEFRIYEIASKTQASLNQLNRKFSPSPEVVETEEQQPQQLLMAEQSPQSVIPEKALQIISFFQEQEIGLSYINQNQGTTIETMKFKPDKGVKIKSVLSAKSDLEMALGAESLVIRRDGTHIAFDTPLKNRKFPKFQDYPWQALNDPRECRVALGVDQRGELFEINLSDSNSPHILAAGQTGGGKTEAMKSAIASLISRYSPDQVQIVLLDPKIVAFSGWENLPHLFCPIRCDVDEILETLSELKSLVKERFREFKRLKCSDIASYNLKADKPLPRIVVFCDEWADVVAVDKKGAEDVVKSIAALARAAGIHLWLATQRPDKDVVTGVIKANLPFTICYRVKDATNSRIVLNSDEGSTLLGKGDSYVTDGGDLNRVQSFWLGDQAEVEQFLQRINQRYPSVAKAQPTPSQSIKNNNEALSIKEKKHIISAEQSVIYQYVQKQRNAIQLSKLIAETQIPGWGIDKYIPACFYLAEINAIAFTLNPTAKGDSLISLPSGKKSTVNLDFTQWQSVDFPDKLKHLPVKDPGVYVVYSDPNKPIYIGQTGDLWQRWSDYPKPHHCFKDLLPLAKDNTIKVAFLKLLGSNEDYRKSVEDELILKYEPTWNGTSNKTAENAALVSKTQPFSFEKPKEEQDIYQKILFWIKENGGKATTREVQKGLRSEDLKADGIRLAFERLESQGKGRVTTSGRGAAQSIIFEI